MLRWLGGWQTLVVAGLLTLLVWVVAEAQTLRNQTVTMQIALEGQGEGDGQLIVRTEPRGSWTGTAEVQLAGSAAALSDLGERLRSGAVLGVGRELPTEPGEHEIVLQDVLRRTEPLAHAGVTIVSVLPERLRVEVERLVRVELPVRVEVLGARTQGTPTAEPSSVGVFAPAALIELLGGGEGLEVTARVNHKAIASVVPGQPERVSGVLVILPEALAGAWGVRVERPRIDVDLTLASRSSVWTIERLPVRVVLAPSELGRWLITIDPGDQDLTGVRLSGPQEALDRVKRGEIMPMAVVELGFEELERGVESKPVRVLGLPEGVSWQAEDATVRLSVERQEQTPPAKP